MSTDSNKHVWRGKHDLQVIGAGFSRTGSYSLKMALEELGFGPCWHIIDIMTDEKKANALLWWKNMDKRLKQDKHSVHFDEFYGELTNGSKSAVDWPTYFYWQELAEYYPKSKLILTVRDKEKWYKSCITALNVYYYNPLIRILAEFNFVDLMHFFATELIPKSVEEFGGVSAFYKDKQRVFDTMEQRIKYMNEHYKDRVLIYRVRDGWEPLCKFLEKPIPNKPFPRSNDGQALAKNIKIFVWQLFRRLVVNHPFLVLLIVVMIIAVLRALLFDN